MRWPFLFACLLFFPFASATITYSEDFFTEQYKGDNSSVRWDTCAGNVSMPVGWSSVALYSSPTINMSWQHDVSSLLTTVFNKEFFWIGHRNVTLFNFLTQNGFPPWEDWTYEDLLQAVGSRSIPLTAPPSDYFVCGEVGSTYLYLCLRTQVGGVDKTAIEVVGTDWNDYDTQVPLAYLGTRLVLGNSLATEMVGFGDYLYVSTCDIGGGGVNGFFVVSIFDPLAPAEAATRSIGCVSDLFVLNNRLYTFENSTGNLSIWDLSDPANPSYLGGILTGISGSAGLQVNDTKAFVVGRTGIRSFDVSNPAFISQLDAISCPGANFGDTPHLAYINGQLFRPVNNRTTLVFNVSNAADISQKGSLSWPDMVPLGSVSQAVFIYNDTTPPPGKPTPYYSVFASFSEGPCCTPSAGVLAYAPFDLSGYRAGWAMSKNIASPTDPIGWAKLAVVHSLPPDTQIVYRLNNQDDGSVGSIWPLGVATPFPIPSTGHLRWNAYLSGTGAWAGTTTPVLDSLQIQYGPFECDEDSDCITQASRCNGITYETRTYSCNVAEFACVYGPWVASDCSVSKAQCSAQCSSNVDCGYQDSCVAGTPKYRDYPPYGTMTSGQTSCNTDPYACSCSAFPEPILSCSVACGASCGNSPACGAGKFCRSSDCTCVPFGTEANVLFLKCPRIAYADYVNVTVQCVMGGLPCLPQDVSLDGAYTELVGQQGQSFVFRAETLMARTFVMTALHPLLPETTCDVTRVNTAPSGAVPDFNLFLLPIVAVLALALLRKTRK